ncbi:MAG: hypothetical protein KGY76_01310 [Candidatus Thermoplasmatota archaeon]|nr:hypothetical protein [Candidatus Thermoplasmatota archaeon]
MKGDIANLVLSMLVLTLTLVASIHLFGGPIWWFSPIFGVLSVVGLYFGKKKLVDMGIFFLASSFFYSFRDLTLTYKNLVFVLSSFFLIISIWFFMRRSVLIKEMERHFEGEKKTDHLEAYKKDFVPYCLRIVIFGFSLSLLGSSIALLSSIGPFPSRWTSYLVVLFSAVVIFNLYIVVIVLPKYHHTSLDVVEFLHGLN